MTARRGRPGRRGPASGPGRADARRIGRRAAAAAAGGSGRAPAGTPGSGRARRAAAPGGAERTRPPRPRGRFTGRAVVLGLVLAVLVLSYAYPVRTYLGQRAEIEKLERGQDAQRQRIAGLRAQREKWNDPDYVAAQARERLQMVRPGEVAYVVTGQPAPAGGNGSGQGRAAASGPWYAKMWSSVRAADHPRTAPAAHR